MNIKDKIYSNSLAITNESNTYFLSVGENVFIKKFSGKTLSIIRMQYLIYIRLLDSFFSDETQKYHYV